jgi:hypothetical protein
LDRSAKLAAKLESTASITDALRRSISLFGSLFIKA